MSDTLQSLRKEKGLTQSELAKKIGVTSTTISSWEIGRNAPYPRYIPKLAEVLGVSSKQIFLLTNTKKLIKN